MKWFEQSVEILLLFKPLFVRTLLDLTNRSRLPKLATSYFGQVIFQTSLQYLVVATLPALTFYSVIGLLQFIPKVSPKKSAKLPLRKSETSAISIISKIDYSKIRLIEKSELLSDTGRSILDSEDSKEIKRRKWVSSSLITVGKCTRPYWQHFANSPEESWRRQAQCTVSLT